VTTTRKRECADRALTGEQEKAMPAKAKVSGGLGVGLAVLFYLFFQISKQQPDLARVNAFANDPYDAVGSFAVQFALFVAVISLIRALRRYSSGVAGCQGAGQIGSSRRAGLCGAHPHALP